MKKFSEYVFGDMLVSWWLDDNGHMGMTLIPAEMKDRVKTHDHALEPWYRFMHGGIICQTVMVTATRWPLPLRQTRFAL